MKISSDLILTDWHYIILDFILASAIMAMTLQQLKRATDSINIHFTKALIKKTARNATRFNNRNDLLHVSFALKISIFSETYI